MATNTSEFMCLSRTMTGHSDPPKTLCCPMWSKTWSAALIVVEHQCCEMYTHFTLTPLKRFLHYGCLDIRCVAHRHPLISIRPS